MNSHIRDGGIGASSAFIVSAIVCAYLHGTLTPAKPGEPVRQIAHVQKKTLNCKTVIVYRDKAAKDLGIKIAPDIHIAQARNIPFDGHPYRAIATYSDAGDIDVLAQRLQLPLFAYGVEKSLGIAYGLRDGHTGPVWRLDGGYQILSVKALNLSAVGNVDTGGGWFVGARVGFSMR